MDSLLCSFRSIFFLTDLRTSNCACYEQFYGGDRSHRFDCFMEVTVHTGLTVLWSWPFTQVWLFYGVDHSHRFDCFMELTIHTGFHLLPQIVKKYSFHHDKFFCSNRFTVYWHAFIFLFLFAFSTVCVPLIQQNFISVYL